MDLPVNGVESILSSCYPRVFLYQCAFLNLGSAQNYVCRRGGRDFLKNKLKQTAAGELSLSICSLCD